MSLQGINKIWLDKLSQKRENTAMILRNDFAIGNFWNSVVEKYSEQAHFIYELLQNADDAKASKCEFNLTNQGLYFKHNGEKHFFVSNPDTENEDKKLNKLGDINAITAVSQSNKNDELTIGKFGVGFKAVFQYTNSPYIYDRDYQFKIENYIIPIQIEDDLSKRQSNETLFYFPFNKEDISNEKAYSDVFGTLTNLHYPTLFLSNLKEVKWIIGEQKGEYKKENIKKSLVDSITCEKIKLNKKIDNIDNEEYMYKFSSKTINNLNYSIGYFLDEKAKLIPKKHPAFCYFPTKENTNLNFIIHAHFLLTDSREGIKRSENYNIEIIELLSKLAANSLLILRDEKLITDDIINIIPYKKPENNDLFAPFYYSIQKVFESKEILPAKCNTYVSNENAYWAQDKTVLDLFSDEQLSYIINEEEARWVFRKYVRNQITENKALRLYIDDCIKDWYTITDILYMIDCDFIENQSFEWLNVLYEFLGKNNSYWEQLKTSPIFLNQEGKAVPAYERNKKELYEVLFLPSENFNVSERTIHHRLLENELSFKFIKNFGIKEPSLKDEIYNNILPLYDKEDEIDTEPHFKLFFKYWTNEGRPEDFLDLIRNAEFILYKTQEENITYRGAASEIYYPSEELKRFFKPQPGTKFLDLQEYYSIFKDDFDEESFDDFINKLGLNRLPKIIKEETGYYCRIERKYIIDGCFSFIDSIKNLDDSLLLWNILYDIPLIELKKIEKYTILSRPDGRFNFTEKFIISKDIVKIRSSKWLVNKKGEFVAPNEITILDIANEYKRNNNELETFLDFQPISILTENEEMVKFINEHNISFEEIKKLAESKERENNLNSSKKEDNNIDNDVIYTKSSMTGSIINSLDDLKDGLIQFQKNNRSERKANDNNYKIEFDEDEEFTKGVEKIKNQLEIRKNQAVLVEEIYSTTKYSFDWFKAYLQLLTTYGEKQDNQNQKTISFQEIRPYTADNKYFLLTGTSSYIYPEIENANDFKITLIFDNGKKENINIEGVSKKGQDLLVYCRESLSNNTLTYLSRIFKVEIKFTPVIDLIDRLYKAFTNTSNIDQWDDIYNSIPPLNYIYGPPGTGKTTKLCNKINEIKKTDQKAKILVLTPTNKAADVVCKKLWEINSDLFAIRLSSPTDPELEEEGIYRDIIDIDDMKSIDVVASTIHRLPYFDIQDFGLLFKYTWDYVIFDESSMTGLHYITFAIMSLFKTNANLNFIVAGDPKQIPPVIVDEKELENFDFQDENIYKMMNLESFNPEEQVIREIDSIINLETQFRSLPEIGQLFSELSYSGLLKHYRVTDRKDSRALPNEFKKIISTNVTFIDIPLSEDNSIYKVNKLFYSSYHTYCSIFVSEIIKYFDSLNDSKVEWTIGLIAPYKTQAVLLSKLITSYGISKNIRVISDTVHGFQGDECDIVFFVCNPNNYFYSGHEKALLSKEYIYNVAISRAKDYLVVLHPFNVIRNNFFINEIGNSYKKNFGNASIKRAFDIEKILFNDENYIEKNSYISGHDNVNIFGLSEMKYFIKSSDVAIDIQLNIKK